MPSGSVIRYEGKRGLVWRIKYTDAGGVQQMETLGRASDGWTERKAGAALEKRLEAVEKGWRKPKAIVFGDQVNFEVSATAMLAVGSVTALLSVVIAGPVSTYEIVGAGTVASRRKPSAVMLPLSRP